MNLSRGLIGCYCSNDSTSEFRYAVPDSPATVSRPAAECTAAGAVTRCQCGGFRRQQAAVDAGPTHPVPATAAGAAKKETKNTA